MKLKRILSVCCLPLCLMLVCFLVQSSATAQSRWDWYIFGGRIVDGTGKAPYGADILVRGDSIAFIGKVDADTITVKNTLDASGKILSPGFIDVHAHGNPLETPEFRNFLGMGVTTIVLGQDGSSPDPGALNRWFDKVKEARPALNVAVFSGHGSIRRKVGVGGDRSPTGAELAEMTKLLESDLEDGAFGMSSGLEYVPGLYAHQEELQHLARVVGRNDGMIMSHLRSEDDSRIEDSIRELAAQGRSAPVHISHLKVVYGRGEQRAEEVLNLMQSFRDRGIAFTADVYPYEASYTGIGIVFPEWAKTDAEWQQAMDEREEELREYLQARVRKRNGPEAILFGSGKYAGKSLLEAAELEDLPPVELLMEMGPEAASAAHFVMDAALQNRLVTAEKVMISSDGSPTMRHPRAYGSFARIIRRYVQNLQELELEVAIHKMSGLPAQTLGLKKRGTIRKGNKADLLIFDPAAVKDRATYADPHRLSAGFDWVMVNGLLAREAGTFRPERAGRVLKRITPLP